MDKKTNDEPFTGCYVFLLVVFLSAALLYHCFTSSVQSAVYRREGIDVSAWEVFWGARPAERAIKVRQPQVEIE